MRQAMPVSPTRPPGWYTDSADPARERWWDGGEWSHVTRPGPERPAPAPRDPRRAPYVQTPYVQTPYGQPGHEQPGYGQPGYGQPGYGPGGWAPVTGPTTPDGVPLAEPVMRMLGRMLDYIITTFVSTLLGIPFLLPFATALQGRLDGAVSSGTPIDAVTLVNDLLADQAVQRQLLWFQVVSLAVSAVYTVTMLRLRGATVGKMAVGVRVRSWSHEGNPTWNQAVARWVTREAAQVVPVVGPMYWVLDSFWLLWDRRRQALHDKLPGTVVVRTR